MDETIYEVSEDTLLLYESLKEILSSEKKIFRTSLEIGVGNGKISSLLGEHCKHTGVDINPFAIQKTKTLAKGTFFESNLFQNIPKQSFDLIVCNPPYIPSSKKDPDDWITKATVGGKHGYEFILSFLESAREYLSKNGSIILLFSSLSKPPIILEYLEKALLSYELVKKTSILLEELFVYRITKSKLLKHLEDQGFTSISFFAKGKHGEIIKLSKNEQEYALKKTHSNNRSLSVSKKEAEKLQFVNSLEKKSIGPKFISYNEEFSYLLYEFVKGISYTVFLETATYEEKVYSFKELLRQCYILDLAGFSKKELTRPSKNIIINYPQITLIDFERGVFTKKPSNVTQFLQFLSKVYPSKKQFIITIAKDYKEKPSFESLINKLESFVF